MERWLSKSRVLLALCGVLLVAALNRRDPMVYGMFLFLLVVSVLGFVLPWLSLWSTKVRLTQAGSQEIVEGMDCDLKTFLDRTAPWPAFMVDVQTEWEWASRRIVLQQTIPVIRSGLAQTLGSQVRFPCRGLYRLVAVQLSSGFPLGLVHAHHTMQCPEMAVHVLPQSQPVRWPLPWDVAADPLGERVTRQMGQSFELGMLRAYQHGEPLRRVSWHASARLGELVVQHFQQSGIVRLRVVVGVPGPQTLGDPGSAGEQAVRLAAGVCAAAQQHAVQCLLYLGADSEPVSDATLAPRALAQAQPGAPDALRSAVARVAREATPGEQVAVVLGADIGLPEMQGCLSALVGRGCRVVVCIALGRSSPDLQAAHAMALRDAAQQAGFATFMEAP
jgi:uncharacterized protein (DUF58 family)